ncbi:MAG: nucleotide sugar dehydrogenase [Kiloniellales bacterium]
MSRPVIGFAGLTHLGLVSAVVAAARGYRTVGYDADPRAIEAIKGGEIPVAEPGLSELLAANRARLTFSPDPDALAACDLVYLSADVATDDAGQSDLRPIRELGASAAGVLADGAVLVVLCQVPPGFTRALDVDPARRYCQVETLVIGDAVARASEPERFILGCADPAAPLAPALQDYLGAFGCPILGMDYESAELAKIAINMCLVASIGVANTMAELCEKLGADWSQIVPALRLDRRIGAHAYLQPGLGLAGGNLERDLATVRRLAEATGADAGVVRAWTADSAYRRDWVLRVLRETALRGPADSTIAILGLAYKENTVSTKNAPALALIAALRPYRLRVYDPAVAVADLGVSGPEQAASALAACDGADALAIMTPWAEFRALAPAAVAARMTGNTVVDPFGVLDPEQCRAAGLDHRSLGRGR